LSRKGSRIPGFKGENDFDVRISVSVKKNAKHGTQNQESEIILLAGLKLQGVRNSPGAFSGAPSGYLLS
jgi:hypothetical protein